MPFDQETGLGIEPEGYRAEAGQPRLVELDRAMVPQECHLLPSRWHGSGEEATGHRRMADGEGGAQQPLALREARRGAAEVELRLASRVEVDALAAAVEADGLDTRSAEAGEGLQPSSKGARVRFSGSERTVIDGPFAEAKELVAGFWIIQAKSREEAIEWVKRIPNTEGEDFEVELRQVFEPTDFDLSPELIEAFNEQTAQVNAAAAKK